MAVWWAVETIKVADLISGLLKTNVTMEDIGVMAPYRRQVRTKNVFGEKNSAFIIWKNVAPMFHQPPCNFFFFINTKAPTLALDVLQTGSQNLGRKKNIMLLLW